MTPPLIHICHSISNHQSVLAMAGGGAVACFAHCAGTCALCLSGGTALGAAIFKSCQMLARRLAPVLFAFGVSLLSTAGV